MSGLTHDDSPSGKRRSLSREITLALLIKVALLTGLWFFFFQGNPKESTAKPGIEALFASSPRAVASINL